MSIYHRFGLNLYNEIEDKRVVLLQSGGLDSCVLASMFSKFGYEIHHLFIDYGFNSSERDIDNVKKIVKKYGGTLHNVKLEMPWLKDSTVLLNDSLVEDSEYEGDFNTYNSGVYVPLRNTFLLSIAGSLAESLEIPYIACAFDGAEDVITHKPLSGTTDKHPTFVTKLEDALTEGSSLYHIKGGRFRILTPLMNLYKPQIIEIGELFNTDFSLSNSCYSNTKLPCGKCSACITRKKAFEFTGIPDPIFSTNEVE